MDCIFCKILKDEIPSYKIYEDEKVLAFLDITQGTKGHTLVIPKKHAKNIFELDESTAKDVFGVIPNIANALKKAFNPVGLNIISNNEQPLQSVYHFHIHLIPRYNDDKVVISTTNNYGKFDEIYFNKLVKQIKENI